MKANGTKVYDNEKGAVWIVNQSEYRYAHGLRENVTFDPQVACKIKMDAWIKGQPLLLEVEDPFGDIPDSPVVNDSPLKTAPEEPKSQAAKK